MNTYGKLIIGDPLSDAQTLPNAGAVDSTNMVFVAGKTSGRLKIAVYANTAISIADTKALFIDLQTWSDDVAASAVAPFSSAGAVIANGVTLYRILSLTASGGAAAFLAGELITEVYVPEELMANLSHTWLQLVYTTTDNEVTEKVDAFMYSDV